MPSTSSYGPIGRLGRWTASHFRLVAIAWAVLGIGLGVFAPKVEHALSGAGWEATGSESLQVRETVGREFGTYEATREQLAQLEGEVTVHRVED